MAIETFGLTNAGPFKKVTFEFDKHVNVFVGPNNSGKSTALMGLALASVFPFEFPEKLVRSPEAEWEMALLDDNGSRRFGGLLHDDLASYGGSVDALPYIGYSAFIPALRRSTDYRAEGVSLRAEDQWTDDLAHTIVQAVSRIRRTPEMDRRLRLVPTDAALVSDETVIRKMIEMDYAAYRRNRPQIREVVRKVASIASEITEGYEVEFLGIGDDEEGLYPEFRTPDGDLPLNALSQGTQSIIQLLSHFVFGYAQYYDYPEDLEAYPATLIVDEIDAHLHPSWQRRIIPVLSRNFGNLQTFCSTHSPLMLAGLDEGQVQLLTREGGDVKVTRNRTPIFGWSADQILMSLLDVREPTDLTTAVDVQRLGELSVKETLTDNEEAELARLREEVSRRLSCGPSDSQVEFLVKYLGHISSMSQSGSEAPAEARPRVRRKNGGAS